MVSGARRLTSRKKYRPARNDYRARASSRQPVIPPAPLTGDVGRDCGDAGRALLFARYQPDLSELSWRPAEPGEIDLLLNGKDDSITGGDVKQPLRAKNAFRAHYAPGRAVMLRCAAALARPPSIFKLPLFFRLFFKPLLSQATLGVRLRELRWKNSAWLATAETIAGWNGFEIRNAGSGRSPVRKRSG